MSSASVPLPIAAATSPPNEIRDARRHAPRSRPRGAGRRRRLVASPILACVLLSLVGSEGRALGSGLAAAAPGGIPAGRAGGDLGARPARHALLFTTDVELPTAAAGPPTSPPAVLDRLRPGDLAVFVPGRDRSARKLIGRWSWPAWLGDLDRDADLAEDVGGGFDAVGLLRHGLPAGAALEERLVVSTEHAFGGAVEVLTLDNRGALDGSVFGLRRRRDDGHLEVAVVLSEAQILSALGREPHGESTVDVDAFAQDAAGNLYLSFRHDEWVGTTLLADDGIVCLPATHLVYDGDGQVAWVVPEAARIVLDRDGVDALVEHARLRTPEDHAVHTLGDLQGIAIDPGGGRFEPTEAIPGLPDGVPHLLLAGQRLGPTVLTTADGGTIARLDDRPLGRVPFDGGPLGLEPTSTRRMTADLDAVAVLPADSRTPLLDVDEPTLRLPYGETAVFHLDGARPHGWAWVAIGLAEARHGTGVAWRPVLEEGAFRRWLAPEPSFGCLVPTDGRGRAHLVLGPEPGVTAGLWIVAQAGVAGPKRLSPPVALWSLRR